MAHAQFLRIQNLASKERILALLYLAAMVPADTVMLVVMLLTVTWGRHD